MEFTFDTSSMKANIKQVLKEMDEYALKSMRRSAEVMANAAAKATPFPIGKMTIPARYYKRPVLNLKKLVEGKYPKHRASEIDIGQLRRGMRYKILDTRRGKNSTFAYCKNLSDADALSKIEIKTRGLSKVMWGKSLPQIGANVPMALRNLMGKAPDIEKYDYSMTELKQTDNETTLTITNSTDAVRGKVIEDAAQRGAETAMKELQFRLKAEMKKKRDI